MTTTLRSIAALMLAALATTTMAQNRPQQLNSGDRERALTEMRAYKHDALAKELALSKEQQRDFFPIYDEMDSRLQQINNETRELERKVMAADDASDTEIEAAAVEIYAQKQKEGKIEMEYFEKFKDVLTPRQLLKLKTAEKRFTQTLVRHHRRLRDK